MNATSDLLKLKGKQIKTRNLFFHFPIYIEPYSENNDNSRDSVFRTRPGSVIIEGNWKLLHYFEDHALELFNLQTDLGERNNLAKVNPKKSK